jgi:hypothetical protein
MLIETIALIEAMFATISVAYVIFLVYYKPS